MAQGSSVAPAAVAQAAAAMQVQSLARELPHALGVAKKKKKKKKIPPKNIVTFQVQKTTIQYEPIECVIGTLIPLSD